MLVRYEYDIFGAIRAETGTCDNTRKFTGKEFDADSNLYYYAARYYDPYIGRFTQRDPIGDGVNWYAYVANNPLKFVDPTGMVIKLVDGNQTITLSDMPDVMGLANVTPQSSNMARLIEIFVNQGDNAALATSSLLNPHLTEVLNSSVVTTVELNTLVSNQMAGKKVADAETIPTTRGEAVDSIQINIDPNLKTLADRRMGFVHELSHASNMLKDPSLANTDEYVSQLTLEYRAYDLDTQWIRSLTLPKNTNYEPLVLV